MPTHLCLTIRFLQLFSHGRDSKGDPEWPPSPLRLFQALVAAAAGRWNERMRLEYAAPALRWLERQKSPVIVAVSGVPAKVKYRLYVPDNVADKVAESWERGGADDIAKYRTEKDIRPTHLLGGDSVHYLWELSNSLAAEYETHKETLSAAARSITHVGWGVDMVAANAAVLSGVEADNLRGERWRAVVDPSATGYRVPIAGTLDALIKKHEAFLNRLGPEGFRPVPPLSAFRVVGYRRATDVPGRPYVAFKLLHPVLERGALVSATRANSLAAMTRHATANAASHKPRDWVDSYVHGHRPTREDTKPRFSYLPLPTIQHRREGGRVVSGIRRVVVSELVEASASHLLWVRQMLPGQFLIDEQSGEPRAMLAPLSASDWVLRQYTDSSDTWATVTPVVLPGSDDGKFGKAEKLFLKSLHHAGYPPDALAELEWRDVSFWAGGDLALRFQRPDYLRKDSWSVYHVRLRWKRSIKGPVAVGAGRHCGLGVFAALKAD